MVPLLSLWLPVLVAAVVVFVASAIVHMVLRYHRTDYTGLPNEADVLAAMREAGVGPGQYAFPYSSEPSAYQSEEMIEKCKKGPVGLMTVIPSGPLSMGKNLVWWFLFCLVVSDFSGYIASRTLGPGTEYLEVFQITGTAAFMAYGLGGVVSSIWKQQRWSVTLKEVLDGLVYALLTGGVFGWLWPA